MEQIEKQSELMTEIIPVPGKNGGARPGAGRPKGSLNKISAADILDAIDDTLGIPYAVQLALNYQRAVYGQDAYLTAKYDQFLLSKVVADRVDITSNGQTLDVQLNFVPRELPEYITITPQ